MSDEKTPERRQFEETTGKFTFRNIRSRKLKPKYTIIYYESSSEEEEEDNDESRYEDENPIEKLLQANISKQQNAHGFLKSES